MVHAGPTTWNNSVSQHPFNNLDFPRLSEECLSFEACFGSDMPQLPAAQDGSGCFQHHHAALPSHFTPHPAHHVCYHHHHQQHSLQQRSTGSASKRLRWSPELHRRFEVSVEQLGGPDKALPSQILKLMNVDQLTIFHIKSHLQRYRGKASASRDSSDPGTDSVPATSGAELSAGAATSKPLRRDSSQTIALKRSSSSTPTPAPLPPSPATQSEPQLPLNPTTLQLVPPGAPSTPSSLLPAAPPLALPSSQLRAPAHSPDPHKLEQALKVQMELQKQLFDQLKIQKELQASLEEHAVYIQQLVGRSRSKRESLANDTAPSEGEVQSRRGA